jgi:mediator of RNA polymerase II transcription subunit 6
MESIHPLDMNHLSKRTGMEYILQDAQEPHLFVIRKQKREGPEKVSAQAAYYVLDGSIYQAPHLYNVIGSRVVRSLYHITNAFALASAKLEKIGNETEDGKPDADAVEVQLKKASTKAVDVKEVMRVDSILAGVMRKLPPAPPPPQPLVPVTNTVPGTETTTAATTVQPEEQQASAKRLKVER